MTLPVPTYSSNSTQQTLPLELSLPIDQPPVVEIAINSGFVLEEHQTSEAIAQNSDSTPAIADPSTTKAPWQTWQIFGSTFLTIFLAELGDKTQVSTLLMSAEFHKPWVIFAGAATALITTSLLGVLVGCWLSSRISPKTLDKAAGILLAVIAASLIWDVFQG